VSAIPPLIVQADVERAVGGVVRLAELTCENESRTVDTDLVDWAISRATDRVSGILLSGWSLAQIQDLVAIDTDARSCVAELAAMFLGSRKDDFIDQATGKFPYQVVGEKAEKALIGKRAGNPRSSAEEVVGRNRSLGARITARPRRKKVFAGGRGGF
jgi:hypothetical protein